MGLGALVTNLVATAKTLTADLQVNITHRPHASDDAWGNRVPGTATTYGVIMENKERMVRATDGTEKLSRANIQFLEPVTISVQDEITLPDGSKPQILIIEGVVNPSGVIYAPKVYF